ncbi:MAG: hypothetical protein NT136_00770 [Candidatus Moranbacteria bacterium]|nr:hypothetical protein [Candidatus Moranbacteria bacterium]
MKKTKILILLALGVILLLSASVSNGQQCPEGYTWDPEGQQCILTGSPGPGPGPSPTGTCPNGFEKKAGVCFPTNTGLSDTPVADIIENFLMWLLGIFGFIAIIAFIISGIQYLTSAGEEKAIETAKRNMKWSIVGVIIALAGFVIILAVDAALKASSTYF